VSFCLLHALFFVYEGQSSRSSYSANVLSYASASMGRDHYNFALEPDTTGTVRDSRLAHELGFPDMGQAYPATSGGCTRPSDRHSHRQN